jgi:type I restriction enzyme S subunit
MIHVKLNQVCKILNGFAFKSEEYQSDGVPLLRISNFDDGNVVVDEKSIYVNKYFLKTKTDFIVEKGDILIALSGATTGKYGIYNYDFPSLLNQRIGLIKSSASSKLSGKYFYHYLNVLKGEILRNAGGAAQPNISTKTIGELEIPLPPLPQQQKIAAILDAADALRQNNKVLIAKYDELTQALFLDMFGDPVSNPKGWEKREILDLINPSRPITYGILMPKEDVKPLGIPYIKVIDVKNGQILHDRVCHTTEIIESKYKRSRLKENDLLISIRGHVGRICLVPQIYINANITQDTARLDFKKEIEPLFAEYCLGSIEFQRYMSKYVKGAGVKGINLGDLKKLLLIVPDINIQKRFAIATLSLKLQKDLAQKSFAKSEDLFNSLLQKAFKGELV